jgi:hypothetical protein
MAKPITAQRMIRLTPRPPPFVCRAAQYSEGGRRAAIAPLHPVVSSRTERLDAARVA